MDKKILIIGTYPIASPQHGGQKRAAAIYESYKSVFKEVIYSAVFFKGFYKTYSKTDIPLGPVGEKLVSESPFTGDIVCGNAINNDPVVRLKMRTLIENFKPDVIHIEQPFPYLGLKKLLNELNASPKLIFGSQNIEAPMKREILENAHISSARVNEAVNIITDLEKDLSSNSSLVAACTKNDLEAHERMGARNLVLAPNGISKSKASQAALNFWKQKFTEEGIDRTALFVGSAHPPNWIGFFDMAGKGLGYLPIDSRIIIAGSICDYFESNIKAETLDVRDATFWQRAYSAGRLSEDKLSALLELADVIILPITEGGGSNLKSAEAILADKKVVATDHALRSFEWYKEFPNIWIANTQNEFQQAISDALKASKIERTTEQQKLALKVEWSAGLKELVEKVKEL